MERKKISPGAILKGLAEFAVFWLILGMLPTGWIYDLGAGTGTGQGQMPDTSVQLVRQSEEVLDFFLEGTPATVEKRGLILCPLLRLRDAGYAGEHKSARRRTIVATEYVSMAYPIDPLNRVKRYLISGLYNGYYLAPLEDGSWVCVYFDDYLMLAPGEQLPAGRLRTATTEEKMMLHTMAQDYAVEPVYVLDLYRQGKVNWMLDLLLRFVVFALLALAYWLVLQRFRNRRGKDGRKNGKISVITGGDPHRQRHDGV